MSRETQERASAVPETEPAATVGSRFGPQRTALLIVAAVVLGWLLIKALDDPRKFAVVTLNGLTLAALFFVVASGFTLIFGLMRVVNMAHGSLYLLGGYIALEMQDDWFKEEAGLGLSLSGADDTSYSLLAWIIPLLLATAIIGVLGVLIQQVFLRWNQGQDLRQALITIALSVIIADQMLAAFGGISKDIKTPTDWPDSIALPGDVRFGFFRGVVVLGAAVAIGVGLWWIIKRTRFGKIVRAGVDDRDMVAALGINVQLIFALAFLLGALLAGLGGVLGGTMIALAARAGHVVPPQLADRGDHRRDGVAGRGGDRRAGARPRRLLRGRLPRCSATPTSRTTRSCSRSRCWSASSPSARSGSSGGRHDRAARRAGSGRPSWSRWPRWHRSCSASSSSR